MTNQPISMFRPFEEIRVPLKLLVYGDPGTEKTRRALQMPRPIYMIDMENGASSYAALVEKGLGFYLATKSYSELSAALDELLEKPPGAVGTLIIDPITVAWESIKAGHIERMMQKKRLAPEDVRFDVGTWGRLKRIYGDLMTRILNAPFHVVMIARGKEKIDERGNKLGYGYEGEKSTTFLANVVLVCRAQHDEVLKDRTGTFKESTRRPRVAFTDFIPQTGTGSVHMETNTEAAEKDAYEQDWRKFHATLRELGLDVHTVSAWCLSKGWKRPVAANPGERQRLLRILRSDAAQMELMAFIGAELPPPRLRAGIMEPRDKEVPVFLKASV